MASERNIRPVLEMKGVSFSYPGTKRPALKEVEMALFPYEFVGLIGPNGAGKTTLLRLACGLREASSGTVLLFGEPITALTRKEVARRVAYVPVGLHAPFGMTAREIVTLGRIPHLKGYFEGPKDRAVVRDALAFVEALDLSDRPFATLSSGEQKRILIARALAQEPRVLLLDEPTSNLDIAHGVFLLERLRHLVKERGIAALASIHDLNLALQFCDRIVMLKDGSIVASGRPEEVMLYPLVRDLFGCDVYIGVNEITGSLFMVPMANTQKGTSS